VVFQHGRDNLLNNLLLAFLIFVVVGVVIEQLIIYEALESGEQLEVVSRLDDVIVEEGLDADLVEVNVLAVKVSPMVLRWLQCTVGRCKERYTVVAPS
jgi:hypothetical protein